MTWLAAFFARAAACGVAMMLALAPAVATAQEPAKTQVSLISARAAAAPGEVVPVGFSQSIADGWHTYWRNPGDAAEPPMIEWRLPPGAAVSEFSWPPPATFKTGEGEYALISHVYEGEVVLPFTLTVPQSAQIGQTVRFEGLAIWQECDDSTCVWQEAPVLLDMPIAGTGADDPQAKARLDAVEASVPRPLEGLAATIAPDGRLSLAGPALVALLAEGELRNAHFFPFSREAINPNLAQSPARGPQGISFSLSPQRSETLGDAPLAGVVAFDQQTPAGWVRRGFEVTAGPGAALSGVAEAAIPGGVGGASAAPQQAAAAAPISEMSFPLALVFAFLGGLILNVMPCVFPILSLKALSLAGGAASGEARRHGVVFLAGVLATFVLLAAILMALRAGGAAIGWGFQLQSPLFMGALALLFFAIGLNLLGAFEVGGALQNLGAGLAGRQGDAGAFFTGALAVVAATPCTIPFMAGAMGYAMTQPTAAALPIFVSLGLGFAAPFVALSFAPGLQRRMPKPGPWMDRFKQALAFPMFATAAWATWIAGAQTGPLGVLLVLLAAVALGFLIWAFRAFKRPASRLAAAAAAVLALAAGAVAAAPPVLEAQPWSPERVAELQAEGRPVFVNFTADWCVTCKVNERVALSSARVARAFADAGVVYLKADWTNRDSVIAETLTAYGRSGVPLYLYYSDAGNAQPQVLPALLSENAVISAVSAR